MTKSTRNTANGGASSSPQVQSVFSKFTSSFTARKRNVAEYYIRLKEPHRQYSPGDQVDGTVVLTVTKPLRISHLVVCLHGFVKVYNSARPPSQSVSRDGSRVGGGIGKRGSTYFGDGFASLFENEIALCGEGRLEPGSFEFQFSLEFPSQGIPSSISFERGTISYMITSTLTRPTTMSPTTTCERQVQLVETVDIAPLQQPKPRMVSVETLSRKSINKMGTKGTIATSTGERSRNSSKAGARKLVSASTVSTPQTLQQPPTSPAGSVPSSTSTESSPASSRHTGLLRLHSKSSNNSDHMSSNGHVAGEMVTATIQLLQGGCLPGDKLPLEISISHNRPVKSLQGIIVTMYREGHVDTHPAIPLGPAQPGKKQEYEDYYPKSRTGLGGLSLSSAGSSSGFRKNLSQKIIPLIVDPQSLHATVKTSIQIPEDLFPTISSVPGAMITFKYFIEVVIDLGGKLTSLERVLPRLHMTGWASKFEHGDITSQKLDVSEGFTIPFTVPLTFLNTEGVRREKGVVACVFEVIVGTRDSQRRRPRQSEYHLALVTPADPRRRAEDRTDDRSNPSPTQLLPQETPMLNNELVDERQHDVSRLDVRNGASRSQSYAIPPPEVEEELDEKARIRRAEQQLLPSAPDEDLASRPTSNTHEQPSAPWVFDRQDLYLVQGDGRTDGLVYDGMSALPHGTTWPSNHRDDPAVIPAVGDFRPTAALGVDALERERERLEIAIGSPEDAQRSSPLVLDAAYLQQPAQPSAQPAGPWLGGENPRNVIHPSESQTTFESNGAYRSRESPPVYVK